MVAEAFLKNPKGYNLVLHKKAIIDGGTNSVDNLYWGTQKDNMQDKIKDGHHKIIKYWLGKKGKNNPNSKKINQYSLEGKFIKTWDSMMDIYRSLGINVSNIHYVCKGKRNKAGGYYWEYKEEHNE